ncbi:MAG TPA: ABC transporter substrate-binding protein [Thermoleophilia bacterium]|nr:ABC transporter substrate-binding protein [Thermoleophilia bacterium]
MRSVSRRNATSPEKPRVLLIAFTLVLVVACLAAILGAGVALGQDEDASSPAPDEKVVVKVGWMGEIDNLNPLIGWTNNVYEIYANEYLLMVARDWEDFEPCDGGVAKSWELSEDELVWTFTVNEGLTWHDGEPVTAADAAFTYNYIIENEIAAYINFLTGVERAEVVDDYTYRVICAEPVANLLTLWIPCLPEHIWGDLTAKEASLTFGNDPPCIGNGPFQVVEWKRDQYLRMEAYEQFHSGAPGPDEVMFVVYQNGDTMVQDLKSGALDAIYLFPPAQFDELVATEGIEVIEYPWYNWDYVGFNCYEGESGGHPVLRDRDFRAALEYAIDRDKLIELAYSEHAWAGYTFLPPDTWRDPDYAWQPPEGERRDFDPAQADAMLDEAGYTDTDGDGLREYEGKNIKIRLWANAESPEAQRAVKLITGYWEDVGVDVVMSVQDEGVYFDSIWGYKGDTFYPDFDAYYWQWDGYFDPGQSLTCFTTDQIEGWNEMAWSNPEFDRLDVLQAKEMDEAQRAMYIQGMQQAMYEDAPCIVTTHPLKLQAYRTDKWDGWSQCGFGEGPAFLTASMPWAYYNLTPKSAEEEEGDDFGLWAAIIAGAVVAILVILALVLRSRRGGPAMEE